MTELDELLRLASLIGCEPQDEERHRKDLLTHIQAHTNKQILEVLNKLKDGLGEKKFPYYKNVKEVKLIEPVIPETIIETLPSMLESAENAGYNAAHKQVSALIQAAIGLASDKQNVRPTINMERKHSA